MNIVMIIQIATGVVHDVPDDLERALLGKWNSFS